MRVKDVIHLFVLQGQWETRVCPDCYRTLEDAMSDSDEHILMCPNDMCLNETEYKKEVK